MAQAGLGAVRTLRDIPGLPLRSDRHRVYKGGEGYRALGDL